METNDLPFCWEGMADVLFDTDGRGEEKETRADCFSPLSCYRIELEMDHCSNAQTAEFSLFFQLDVIVSNNMNLNG